MRSTFALKLACVFFLAGFAAPFSRTQQLASKEAHSGANAACCQITSIKQWTRIVTAKVNNTSQSFEFSVKDAGLLSSLKAGQWIWANFSNGQVSLDGKTPCCQITALASSEGAVAEGVGHVAANRTLMPQACCSITGVDVLSRRARAKVNSTGQSFEFSLPDAVQIQTLNVGQNVWANFKLRQVSLNGSIVCCNIVAGAPVVAQVPSRPSVLITNFWVPLGKVVGLSRDQLSIRTMVASSKSEGKNAPKLTYNHQGGTDQNLAGIGATDNGPTVTLDVKMADPAMPKQLPARATTEPAVSSRAGSAGQQGGGRSKGVLLEPPQPPHIGQVVWVNRTSRQIRWLNFPFSMQQEDDLGDSRHLRTRITVSLSGSGTSRGSVKGSTDVWTFKEFGGFTGSVRVTFADDGSNVLLSITNSSSAVLGLSPVFSAWTCRSLHYT